MHSNHHTFLLSSFSPPIFNVWHHIFIFLFCVSQLISVDIYIYVFTTLSFNLPTSFVIGWSPPFTVCFPLPVRFFYFTVVTFLVIPFYFPLREVFDISYKPVEDSELLFFACLWNCLPLLWIWMMTLLSEVFLV